MVGVPGLAAARDSPRKKINFSGLGWNARLQETGTEGAGRRASEIVRVPGLPAVSTQSKKNSPDSEPGGGAIKDNKDRGRDTGCPAPPAQMPAGAANAAGSCLGCLT